MTSRELLSVQVKPESKARIRALADQMELKISDIARMALARGLDVLEAELGAVQRSNRTR